MPSFVAFEQCYNVQCYTSEKCYDKNSEDYAMPRFYVRTQHFFQVHAYQSILHVEKIQRKQLLLEEQRKKNLRHIFLTELS